MITAIPSDALTGTPTAAEFHPAGITSAGAPLRIGSVVLTVRDLDAVSRFYREAIGLSPVAITATRHRLGAGGRTLLELRRDPEASFADRRGAGLFHTAFLLPTRADLADWVVHANEIGVPLQGASDHLVSEAVYLADPEGNGIEVYHDRPSREWVRDRDGRITMGTRRLDARGLNEAATGRSFAGVPDGTIVGHVHLQVGDLRAAETFYAGLVGLEVSCRYPGATFLGSGGYHHHIGTNVWNSLGAGPRPARTTGLAEIAFTGETAALATVAARLKVPPIGRDGDRPAARDPWGTGLSFAAA